MLTNEKGVRMAIIVNKMMYSLDPLDDEGIAELFNGGLLPIVPQSVFARQKFGVAEIGKKSPEQVAVEETSPFGKV